MARILRAVAVFLGLAAAVPAHAIFHLWTMNELYSNADGTIQFLEMTAITGGQQFLAGHQLVSTGPGGATRTFTFPSDLPGDTSGRRMLIATPGFASLGVVVPDYVVPAGFFFQAGGSINFANADLWTHGPLPADNRSIDRSGNAGTPSPTNFIGGTGVINVAPPLNFQGLWYRGEVERGWGVNVAHQGDILFVTWFTYDTDGTQMWLVGPDFRKTTGNTYAGPLYRTRGPTFSNFDRTALAFDTVGSGSLAFTDGNNGVFNYTVGTVSQSKQIVRQVYSATVPTCTAGGTQSAVLNFQDLWYRSPAESEPGWGINITHQGDTLFVTWFTYDTNGRGMWVVGPDVRRTTGNNFAGALYRTTGPAFSATPWNPAGLAFTDVGSINLSFGDVNNGQFAYTVSGVNQTKSITRQGFGTPATVCRN